MYPTLKQMVVCDAWRVRLDFSTIETKEFKNLKSMEESKKHIGSLLTIFNS